MTSDRRQRAIDTTAGEILAADRERERAVEHERASAAWLAAEPDEDATLEEVVAWARDEPDDPPRGASDAGRGAAPSSGLDEAHRAFWTSDNINRYRIGE